MAGKSHGLFNLTGNLHPKRSTFDLSYSKKFDATFGALYPIMCDEVIPGDTWHIGNSITCRVVNPLMAPVFQNWKIYTHYFFVPYRLLWDKWEEFITGGISGDSVIAPPLFKYYSGRNSSTSSNNTIFNDGVSFNSVGKIYSSFTSFGSISDFLYGVAFKEDVNISIPDTDCPLVFPFSAYLHIYNDYYRDENLQSPLGITLSSGKDPQFVVGESYQGQLDTVGFIFGKTNWYNLNSKGLLYRNWKKDYFTSALTNQQRGTPPTLRFSLSDISALVGWSDFTNHPPSGAGFAMQFTDNFAGQTVAANGTVTANAKPFSWKAYGNNLLPETPNSKYLEANIPSQTVDTGITVSDLRFVTQIQKWQERNMRGGVRYTEFLQAHFGICPRDDRMMRPEYIGGSVQPIVVSEVLQTSPSEDSGVQTHLGRLGGHGLSVSASHCADYTASEYGLVMGLMSIMPEPEYQQGLERQWSRKTKFDFFFPEFQCLSEQEIRMSEIKIGASAEDNAQIFGYQGRFDELRYKKNQTCGELRNGGDFDFYTMSRYFNNNPQLNDDFIVCKPDIVGLFHDDDTNPFIINFGNIIKATRPILSMATPGYLDHF